MRLKTDMNNFLSSSSVRMNCPFPLKFAFLPDGTNITDLTQVDNDTDLLILSRYSAIAKKKSNFAPDGATASDMTID